jgi:hypothetical protein
MLNNNIVCELCESLSVYCVVTTRVTAYFYVHNFLYVANVKTVTLESRMLDFTKCIFDDNIKRILLFTVILLLQIPVIKISLGQRFCNLYIVVNS